MTISGTSPARFLCLSESEIWRLKDTTIAGKLYLLALAQTDDREEAREMVGIAADEVRAVEAWLVQRGYARFGPALVVDNAPLAA